MSDKNLERLIFDRELCYSGPENMKVVIILVNMVGIEARGHGFLRNLDSFFLKKFKVTSKKNFQVVCRVYFPSSK